MIYTLKIEVERKFTGDFHRILDILVVDREGNIYITNEAPDYCSPNELIDAFNDENP